MAMADFTVSGWADNGATAGTGLSAITFDKIEFFIAPGSNTDVFWDGNGVGNFRIYNNGSVVSDWSATQINPGYVLATGTTPFDGSINYLQWDMYFKGTPSVYVDYLFWRPGDTSPIGAIKMWSFNGSINYDYYTALSSVPTDYDRSPVPIPAAIWLFAPGLLSLAGLRKRISK
jgi:hypothetical protein